MRLFCVVGIYPGLRCALPLCVMAVSRLHVGASVQQCVVDKQNDDCSNDRD